ncbi:hypothetical protein PSEUBRA_004848 [Kalmanozyma brasiliensis GHG001]|uniref:uncharacterized protein n=1 Tax=Kalmanozyma brasiliensis (strain GHG001) TaxID=1365824 RepID=UPI002867FB18|nr:uncharacterized protein PSEUBRA_004848 [Kalmanozyma brasiliensis GHG001]KAF6767437.1 hypothetical protein PSEUBRA_004848 [Kalmanozyma brasiliensis GHG001]
MCAFSVHVLFALIALMTIFHRVDSSSIALEDLERLLLMPIDDVAEASHPASSSLNLDGSWEDILHQNNLIAPQTNGAHQVPIETQPGSPFVEATTKSHPTGRSLELDGSWEDILHQSTRMVPQAAEPHQPIAAPEIHPGQVAGAAAVSLPPLLDNTLDQRLRRLTTVKDYFYLRIRAALPSGENLLVAHRGALDQEVFSLIATKLAGVDRRHGMYPIQIGAERYLLEQARPTSHDFRVLNGFNVQDRWHIWYGVYHEIGRVGTKGTFSYVGAFRGPYAQVNTPFRDRELGPTAVKLSDIRALSGSTFEAQVQPYS